MRVLAPCFIFLVLFFSSSKGQDQYDLTLSGSLTTSSKLFRQPDDFDDLVSGEFLPINNILGFGIDVRRKFEEHHLQAGLSIEYLTKTESGNNHSPEGNSIRIKDGFTVIPIELTGYFAIPFSSERVEIYMGGGGGTYLGRRNYQYGNVRARSVQTGVGFGIHVLSGVQYELKRRLALRIEMKFRNVQFRTGNSFPDPTSIYYSDGTALPSGPFPSRISIDGMDMTLGLVFHF